MVSRFSVEIVLSYNTESFGTRTLLSSRKFLVSENVEEKRGDGCHDFSSKFLVSQYQKNFAEEPFCVSEKLRYGSIFQIRVVGGRVSQFSVETFCSHSTKTLCWRIVLCFVNFRLPKPFLIKEGGFTIFWWIISVSQSVEIFRRGTLLSSKNFLVWKIIEEKRESGCHDFPSKTFGLTEPKQFEEEFFCLSLLESERINNKRGRG